MRVLITGGSGQLGTSLQRILSREVQCFAPSHSELDITDREAVMRVFDEMKPNIVIHTAAYNRVDLAETQRELCYAVNVLGTKNVAEAGLRVGAYLISLSTDYVFDGKKQSAYLTSDKKNPLSYYGKTKSEGENIVLELNHNNAVLRTAWLFGLSSENFVEAILRKAKEGQMLRVVADQIGNPTYASDLAELIAKMIELRPNGILHGTNTGACSRVEYAREILRIANVNCAIEEISSAEYPTQALRPVRSELSNACLADAGLPLLPKWQDALARYINDK